MKPLRILLLSTRAAALRASLERAGREIVCASTADEALACLEAGADALVLIEEDAGALDGPAVLRQLREQARSADTLYVLLAASADPEHLLQAWRDGADDCLALPFDPRLVANRIERLVNHGIPGTINTQSKGATRCGFTLVGLKDDALETTIMEVIVQNLITAIAHGDET